MKTDRMKSFEKFFANEIGVEIKACLYFTCMLTFYFIYRIITGSWEAEISHMIQMVISVYIIGCIQFWGLSNFDEMDEFCWKVVVYSLLCSFVYMILSFLLKWYDGNIVASVSFFVYMEICYISYFIIYKIKKRIDTEILNDELKQFKQNIKKQ